MLGRQAGRQAGRQWLHACTQVTGSAGSMTRDEVRGALSPLLGKGKVEFIADGVVYPANRRKGEREASEGGRRECVPAVESCGDPPTHLPQRQRAGRHSPAESSGRVLLAAGQARAGADPGWRHGVSPPQS